MRILFLYQGEKTMTVETKLDVIPEIKNLLEDLCAVSGINCVIRNNRATVEIFFNQPGENEVRFLDGWGTIASPNHHIHFRSDGLRSLRFFDEAGECVGRSTSMAIYNEQGEECLRFYFANETHTYQEWTAEELNHFENFKAKYAFL